MGKGKRKRKQRDRLGTVNLLEAATVMLFAGPPGYVEVRYMVRDMDGLDSASFTVVLSVTAAAVFGDALACAVAEWQELQERMS